MTQVQDMVTEYSDPREQENRIRAALGLANGPLPEVRSTWLHRYYGYLAANLSLPFEAQYAEDVVGRRSAVSAVTVLALLDPGERPHHEQSGLLCRALRGVQEIEVPLADVELTEQSPNYRLVEDYWYWFWNWRFDPQI